MIRSIKQRLYLLALLPLAVLAIALVIYNGIARISEVNQQLREAQSVTVDLLRGPAVDGLVLGATEYFEALIGDVIQGSERIVCITLVDLEQQTVSTAGQCPNDYPRNDAFVITASSGGFSDIEDTPPHSTVVGTLRVSMDMDIVAAKQRWVFVQLLGSLLLIALVATVIGGLLRSRLIQPIEDIDATMQAVGKGDYSARVQAARGDELGRLSLAINQAIQLIEENFDELEYRRDDATRALNDADTANLARDGLVRSLVQDLEEPLGLLHIQLTDVAIANQSPQLREPIKAAMAQLQEAQANFDDLIEIATSEHRPKPTIRFRDLDDIMNDIERDVAMVSDTEQIPVHFQVTHMPHTAARALGPTGVYLEIDSGRLKKALSHLIRALGRRCLPTGVYVNAEVVKRSHERLNVSVYLKAFIDSNGSSVPHPEGPLIYTNEPPALLGWSDREHTIIEYLLHMVGVTPTYSASPTGTINIVLDTSCPFRVTDEGRAASAEWLFGEKPISTCLVTNDMSLARLTTRGGISNHDITLVDVHLALTEVDRLLRHDAVLIDLSDDIASAVTLTERVKGSINGPPELIAVCPSGPLTESLSNRLFELGFNGIIQKPLHYGRVVEVIRTTLANPLRGILPVEDD